ncbi:hypothetical protein MUG78_17200 [Gordonia alkaliphila]|uniref:hypothetical protein n=1 Tax=Gordonia alkaliphila TaxID=1053547 RepID=UPI001FF616BE|nr:hypothetical protein [Gordonia alkaliphila]MCK0441139.1 hypothetical protein [Gordonia alkaliphila]
MIVNGVKSWFKDKVQSHYAQKYLKVGEWALRTKITVAAIVICGCIILVGGAITAAGSIASPVNSLVGFLNIPGELFGGADPGEDAENCFTDNQVDPSFTALVEDVPAHTPVDVAAGWLIYAAPHQGTSRASSTLTFDQFETAWQQVQDGAYTAAPATTPRRSTSSEPGKRTRTPLPAPGLDADSTVEDVVAIIDPAGNYKDYVDQANAAAIYLLITDHLDAPQKVADDLIGATAEACAKEQSIPTVPLLDSPN